MRKALSNACEKLIQRTYEIANLMKHQVVSSEHLLIAICEDISLPMSQYLLSHGVNASRLMNDCDILFEKNKEDEEIRESLVLKEIIQNAKLICKDKVMVNHLCRSLLVSVESTAIELLYKYHIDIEELLEVIEEVSLDEFECCLNLNKANRNPHVTGRDKEMQWIINGLCRKEKANILLIGEAGVGKSAIIEKLAERIETKNCPEKLYDHTIYELSLNHLVAGTKYRGEFEEKLQKIIHAIEKNPKSILFIDEMHQILGAGRADGSLDVAGILKPMLARGVLKCIGATTKNEYHQFIEKDQALERRFQIIRINEPQIQEVRMMMANKLKEYESYHNVRISEEMLDLILELSQFYMPTRYFPDKAFDLLDMACVITASNQSKQVTRKQIEEAIEPISLIPAHINNKKLEESLRQVCSEELTKHILELYNRPIQKQVRCWYILDPDKNGKEILAHLSIALYKQDIIYLDTLNLDSTLQYALNQIKLNPFSVLVIQHFHESSYAIQSKIRESINQGYYIHQMNKISFKHLLVCILDEKAKHKSYLRDAISSINQPEFCQDTIDFSYGYASN